MPKKHEPSLRSSAGTECSGQRRYRQGNYRATGIGVSKRRSSDRTGAKNGQAPLFVRGRRAGFRILCELCFQCRSDARREAPGELEARSGSVSSKLRTAAREKREAGEKGG